MKLLINYKIHKDMSCYPIQVTGTGLCPFNLQILRRLVLVPLYDSNGDLNKFDNVDDVTLANIQAKFDETTEADRYYSLPLLENVEQPRAETTFFEYNSGNKARVKQGTRTFTGWMPNSDPQFLGRLQSWYNQEFGFFGIDKWGNFVYAQNLQDDADTGVYPISIDGMSWDVNMVTATDAEPFYTMLQFDYKQDFNDAAIRYIDVQSLDFDGRTGQFYGLLPLVPKFEVLPTAGVTTVVKVTTDYDVPVSGLIVDDFTMVDLTTSANLAVTDAVEDSVNRGSYTLTSTTTVIGNLTGVYVTQVKYQSGAVEFTPIA